MENIFDNIESAEKDMDNEGLFNNIKSLITESNDAAYKRGYEEGKQVNYDRYIDGLYDAWKIAQKVTNDYTIKELRRFGLVLYDESLDDDEYKYSCRVIAKYPISEVKTKIEEYEKQQEPENKKGKTFGEVFEENFKPFKVVKDYAGYKIYKNETEFKHGRCWFAIGDETWNEPVRQGDK